MLPLPSPRSSKSTTRAPQLLTEVLTLWNFAATAEAGLAMTSGDEGDGGNEDWLDDLHGSSFDLG